MSVSYVWVQLYYEGIDEPQGNPIEITSSLRNVNALAEAVKDKMAVALSHCDAARLVVYPPGTTPPFSGDKALESWTSIPDSSGPEPLIVVAPAPPQQQPANASDVGPPLKKLCLPLGSWVPLSNISKPVISGPALVAQEGWLRNMATKIATHVGAQDSLDGSFRVPLTSLARCSRGGKTRALYELAHQLWNDHRIMSLFVTFNDYCSCEYEKEQGESSLDMLCRRIAFAARPINSRGHSAINDFKSFRNLSVSSKDVETWIGDQQVVLLIDELNRIDMQPSLVRFLKENFCIVKGRYFVFSSHTSATNPEQSAPSSSFREMETAGLPLISELKSAREKLGITELTPRLALYYGLIPGLLVTTRTSDTMTREEKIQQRVKRACRSVTLNFTILEKIVDSFFQGSQTDTELDELLDATGGQHFWIPCYLIELLKLLGEGISGEFGHGLRAVANDSEGWSTCKEASGDGWESLFLLVLWLRIAGRQSQGVDCIPDIPGQSIQEQLFYNYPFPGGIANIKNVGELKSALEKVRHENFQWDGNFPKVSIYYPKHAQFKDYDFFVCVWRREESTDELTNFLYGYQLKEGKAIPGKEAPLKDSYLFRGCPATDQRKIRNWNVIERPRLQQFFGLSGKRWLPEQWAKLYEK